MARPPVDIRERKPRPEDAGDIAKAVWELSRETNEGLNRAARDAKPKTSSYTMDPLRDRIILADGTITITLPDAAEADHTEYTVVRTGAAGTVTVDTGGGDINGAATVSLSSQFDTVTVASNGSDYFRTDL